MENLKNTLEICYNEYISSNKSIRELSENYNINRQLLSGYLIANNINITNRRNRYSYKKSNINEKIFDIIDTEEKAYWLGFLYADGYIQEINNYRLELTLSEKDKDHLEDFKQFLESKFEIKYRKNQKAYRFSVRSSHLCKSLINKGCIPKKSLILTFPNEDQVSNNYIHHFIRGYFDGDGSIYIKKNSISPDIRLLGTFEFLDHVKKLLLSLNINTTILKDKRHLHNTFYLKFKVSDGMKFLNYIYNNSNVFLKRKKQKYEFAVQVRNHLNN